MAEQHLTVLCDAGEPFTAVTRFSIVESLSRPFVVTLVLRAPNVGITLDGIVNRPASFRIDTGVAGAAERQRSWTGVCNHFEQLRPEPETASTLGQSTYLMRIVPTLWLLSLSRDQRIFRHRSIPQILGEVLAEWEIPFIEKLTRGSDHYPPLEYVVQYAESDLDFVGRLCARAGITYLFAHSPDAPTQLTLIDEPQRATAGPPIEWEDRPTENRQIDLVTNVRLSHAVKPGRVTLRDYDFHRPADFPLRGLSRRAADPEGHYEHYRYDPGGFRHKSEGSDPLADSAGQWAFRHTLDEGRRRAERQLDSLRRGKRTVRFDTNAVGLAPGRVLSFLDYPREDLGPDKTMLVTAMTLDGEPADKWQISAEAVFTDVAYQPEPATRSPRIAGIQSAIVTGPMGEEIYPDEYGRVKAQFHWDRKGKRDAESSCWIPVSQAWAGSAFGMMLLPRIGHEVLVTYLEGDPDLPVVLGRAYDRTRPVPYALPDHDEKTLYKTKSSPFNPAEENAYNELRFDDTRDAELVYLQAQKDCQHLVKRHETERTGESRAAVVGEHRGSIVATLDAHLVGTKYSVQVTRTPDAGAAGVKELLELKLLEQRMPELSPSPTKIEMVHGRVLATSGDASMVMKGAEATFVAKGELSFKAGGRIVIWGGPNIKINC